MVLCRRVAGSLVLAVALVQWRSGNAFQAQREPRLDSSLPLGPGHSSPSDEDKSAADLAAKLLLLDELVSLENDVIETKKKRSFSGFGSPLDRLSMGSMDLKTKQKKVVEVPKRRFGIPLDRIGANRLNNSKG
ncbi:osteocrin isoform X2 [Anolis sagrei]|nr:osteocrin isoform X2 [Anolis sagrei ordinatus]